MKRFGILFLGFISLFNVYSETSYSSVLGGEVRAFTESGDDEQDDASFSISFEPEWLWQKDQTTLVIKPFARFDSMDSERTHWDIREAYWQYIGEGWELRAGLNKVFWGVAETQHLVDIVNQSDALENIDMEDKLGQPMINVLLEKEWGVTSLFVLPYFRERQFAGKDGRLRLFIPIDNDKAVYESSQEKRHIDLAGRWSNTFDEWDIGFSMFKGTSREPLYQSEIRPEGLVLVPYYAQITQFGFDIQATFEDWLWKLELIKRNGFGEENYFASVFGFEYSMYGILDSNTDLGFIFEVQLDERDALITSFGEIELSNILTTGFRFALNDVQSTDFLIGLGAEMDNDAQFISLEGSTRVGDDMKLNIEGRIFTGIDDSIETAFQTFFYSYRKDDFIQITFEKYF